MSFSLISGSPKYKIGQLVTINNTVYRFTKPKYEFSCIGCSFYKDEKYMNVNTCIRYCFILQSEDFILKELKHKG